MSLELHDDAGQALTALKLGLELLQRELPLNPAVLRQNLAEAIALSESTKERGRLLALGLRPPGLDTVGLNLTLEAFCRDFSRRTHNKPFDPNRIDRVLRLGGVDEWTLKSDFVGHPFHIHVNPFQV